MAIVNYSDRYRLITVITVEEKKDGGHGVPAGVSKPAAAEEEDEVSFSTSCAFSFLLQVHAEEEGA